MHVLVVLVALAALLPAGTAVGRTIVAVREPRGLPTSAIGPWGDVVPPTPAILSVVQPDGTSFPARLTPAELGGLLEHDGYSVRRGADGWWRYVRAAGDGTITDTAALVGVDPVPAAVARGAGRRAESIWSDGRGGDVRAAVLQQLRLASAAAQARADAAGEPRVLRFPLLMLATWWDEEAGQTEPQFQPGSDSPEHFRALLNGFGGNPRGSLTEFYFESSYGRLLVEVEVFGPFVSNRSRLDRCYYGGIEPPPLLEPDDLDPSDSFTGGGGLGVVGMAAEVVPQADPTVDFRRYDNDGDGYVDFVAIVHSGPDMASTGDPCHTWSHALPVSTFGDVIPPAYGLPPTPTREGLPTTDGVLVDRVFTMAEMDRPGRPSEIGVAVHEMAQTLGEPDYYASNYTSAGSGEHDVMAFGFGDPATRRRRRRRPSTRRRASPRAGSRRASCTTTRRAFG